MAFTKFNGFTGGSYSTTIDYENQRTINLYPENSEYGGLKTQGTPILRSIPGLKHLNSFGGPTDTIRGIYQSNEGTVYVCCGSKLYSIDKDGNETPVFDLKTSVGPVSMVDNRIGGLVLVDGSNGYYLEYSASGGIHGFHPTAYNSTSLTLLSEGHTLKTGESIKITGLANYADTYIVTVIDEDKFSIPNTAYVPTAKRIACVLNRDPDDNTKCILTTASNPFETGYEILLYANNANFTQDGLYAVLEATETEFKLELELNTPVVDIPVYVDVPLNLSWELTNKRMTEISGLAWRGSDYVEYQDSYFIFSKNTEEGPVLYYGEDPLNLDPLDFTIMSDQGDGIVRVISDHGVLWVLRDRSAVVYVNTGVADNVWQPQGGSRQEAGCISGSSVQKCGGRVLWLASSESGSAMVMTTEGGYTGTRISTHAVERALNKSNRLSEASAWSYQLEGHVFYCLNVPDLNTTWVYDLTTGIWSERGIWRLGKWERDPVEYHAYAFGKHIVGAYDSSLLWELDNSVFTQYREDDLNTALFADRPITWLRQSPFVSNMRNNLVFNALILDIETGQSFAYDSSGYEGGNDSIWGTGHIISTWPVAGDTFEDVQGAASKLVLSWSDNGGRSFTPGIELSSGFTGEFTTRTVWRRLGHSRSRIFRLMGSVSVSHNIIDAILDIEQGAY